MTVLRNSGTVRRLLGSATVLALAAFLYACEPAPPQNFKLHDAPKPLPEITFRDGSGKGLSLAAFRGKVVLLNVWATWCGPCRREMPALDRLQAKLGGPGFTVAALSIDRKGIEVVRPFYKEVGIRNLAIYISSSGKATGQLAVTGLPTTLLIGRDGRELGRLVGPAEWDAPKMVEFLKGITAKR